VREKTVSDVAFKDVAVATCVCEEWVMCLQERPMAKHIKRHSQTKRVRQYIQRIRDYARHNPPTHILNPPLSLQATFMFAYNRTWRDRPAQLRHTEGMVEHSGKPGLASLIEPVLDGLAGIVFERRTDISDYLSAAKPCGPMDLVAVRITRVDRAEWERRTYSLGIVRRAAKQQQWANIELVLRKHGRMSRMSLKIG